jgi:pyruvate/2-oxoglutarate dehydrogenase complex dihydrolipoamide dehydrogenase (E3) component
MAGVETYDALVFGGGKAGKTLAMDLAKSGRRTALVERGMIGGSCINVACIPTKTLVRSAKVAELAHRAGTYGVRLEGAQADLAEVRRHKRDVVNGMIALNRAGFDASGMDFLLGEGRFVAPKTLEVRLADGGTRRLTAARVFINTGTRAAVPDTPGLADARPLTHVSALELDRLPEHLVILGGGFIGLEFGQAFRRFGSRVTIVQRGPQLAPREDADVAEGILQVFREDGIDVLLAAEVFGVEGLSGEQVRLRVRTPRGERTLEGTDVLVAAGRTPNTDGIGLDVAGVALDERGYVRVNERLETTAPGVWALGEVAGSPQFTHVSLDDYRIVKANLDGGSRTTRGRLIPYTVFIDPELGRVGLGESEARRQGRAVRVARLPAAAVPRARTLGETRGFWKAVVEAHTDQVLGFAMLGAEAGEVTAVVQVAMLAGLPYTALRDAILSHPTMAEGLNLLFANLPAVS